MKKCIFKFSRFSNFIIIILFFSACELDNNTQIDSIKVENNVLENNDIQEIRGFVEKEGILKFNTKDKNLRISNSDFYANFFEKEVDWKSFNSHRLKDGKIVYEFILSSKNLVVPRPVMDKFGNDIQSLIKTTMMIVKVNQSWKTLIVRYYPMSRKDAAIMEKVNYHDLPIDWNGVIDLYNMDERHLNSYLVVNGKSLKSRLFIKSDFRENSLYGPDCFSIYVDYPVYGINGGVGSIPSGWVTICNPSSSGGPSGSGSGSYFPPEYSGGGTGTSSPPSSGGNSQPTCVDNSEFCFNPPGSSEEEIIKDPSFIGTKAECLLNNLSETSNGFNSMLSKFDGDFSLVDLKFAISNELNNSTNGTTSQEGNMIIVKLNGNTLNSRTNLGVARTLIHEIIHAEMFRKVRSMGGYVSQNDFPGIYDYYRRFAKNWQHEQMAAHYVSIIGDYLYEFDSKQKPLQFYRDFAWVGLYLFEDQNSNLGGNISSQAWKDLNELDKERILNSINDGETNGSKVCN